MVEHIAGEGVRKLPAYDKFSVDDVEAKMRDLGLRCFRRPKRRDGPHVQTSCRKRPGGTGRQGRRTQAGGFSRSSNRLVAQRFRLRYDRGSISYGKEIYEGNTAVKRRERAAQSAWVALFVSAVVAADRHRRAELAEQIASATRKIM
jgi:hypothetical protein